ncbi:Ammonium transporter AmtB-like domain [Dillenia turbinata]|uniref:Ammonium transporter AmtB-like domain n=1 Tax=Dillenia turbinata TaxID=194707 RepID=A0AAN8YVP2_9MAGN
MSLPTNLVADEASPEWLNMGLATHGHNLASMVYFQFVLASIMLILIAGALLGRMNFRAWILFVPLWLTFSYAIGAYSVWCPDGWLAKLGVIDFAGGFVIHLASGIAGFTAAFWVGKDRENFPPNNILVALAGAGLLWWAGLGSMAAHAGPSAATHAFPNPCIIPFADAGPTFHLRSGDSALVARRLSPTRRAVFAVPYKYITLAYGLQMSRASAGFHQLLIQLIGIVFIIILNIDMTGLICWIISLIVPLRLPDEELEIGDDAVHGEEA